MGGRPPEVSLGVVTRSWTIGGGSMGRRSALPPTPHMRACFGCCRTISSKFRFLRRCSAAACASASSLVLVRLGGGSGGTSIRGEGEGEERGREEKDSGVCVVVVTNGGNAFSYLILSLGSSRNSGHKTQDLISTTPFTKIQPPRQVPSPYYYLFYYYLFS